MIHVPIKDSNNIDLSLGDAIMLHFVNTRIKFIGLLGFDHFEKCFKLYDNAGGWQVFNPPGCRSVQYLRYNRFVTEEQKKYLGRIELKAGAKGNQQLKELYKIFGQ